MAEYRLTNDTAVIRTEDEAWIPDDPANRDRQIYTDWLANGGEPDPAIPMDMTPPGPTPEEQILFDHENRLRAMEGTPPLELDAFMGHKRRI
jgi:hypothetical protein